MACCLERSGTYRSQQLLGFWVTALAPGLSDNHVALLQRDFRSDGFGRLELRGCASFTQSRARARRIADALHNAVDRLRNLRS